MDDYVLLSAGEGSFGDPRTESTLALVPHPWPLPIFMCSVLSDAVTVVTVPKLLCLNHSTVFRLNENISPEDKM